MPAITFGRSLSLVSLEQTPATPDASMMIFVVIGKTSPLPSHCQPVNFPSDSIRVIPVNLCPKFKDAPSATASSAIHCSKRCFSRTYPGSDNFFSVPSGKMTRMPSTRLLMTDFGKSNSKLATAMSDKHSPQWTGVPISA